MNGAAAGVYVLQGEETLVELTEAAYDSESVLQALLARYPSLLAGGQISPEAPRRWLLVAREVALASEPDGAGRWAVDHLFLDQDAVPTIVEVKRSADTRIRREVVGQMLDYAANAVVHWPLESLRARFEERCAAEGMEVGQALAESLGPEIDPDAFWQQVKTNLQAGRVRLVFVADIIPRELQRIVEFLNDQMDPAEVLALEIKQYAGQGLKTFVPRLVGRSAAASQKTGGATTAGPERQWDEASFLAELTAQRGEDSAQVARALLEWARGQSLRIWWGRGRQSGSFFPMLDHQGQKFWTFSVWTYGRLEIQFQMWAQSATLAEEARRRDLLEGFRQIGLPGVTFPEEALHRRPSLPLTALSDPVLRQRFLEIFEGILTERRAAL